MSKVAEKTNSSFFFSEDSYHSKKNQCPQLSIERRFYFKTMVANYGAYHLYKGVDVHNIQWVHIYGRRVFLNLYKADNPNAFTAVSINENKKNQLCPKLLWSG